MKKCNGCEVVTCEESFAMKLVKSLKKKIFFLWVVIILEFSIILGMAFGGTMLTASAHLKEDYCIIPEVSNHFEELEESRTRTPTKRKCVALKKKR